MGKSFISEDRAWVSGFRTAWLIICALGIVFWGPAWAQVPAFVTYSGRLTDGTGWGQSTQVDLTVTLYDAATGGKVVFRGKHLATMVVDGYFTVNVGMCDSNGACDPNPANAKFPSTLPAQMWIAVAVGSNPEMSPRQPVGSVPYAVNANRAVTADRALTEYVFIQPLVPLSTVANVCPSPSKPLHSSKPFAEGKTGHEICDTDKWGLKNCVGLKHGYVRPDSAFGTYSVYDKPCSEKLSWHALWPFGLIGPSATVSTEWSIRTWIVCCK